MSDLQNHRNDKPVGDQTHKPADDAALSALEERIQSALRLNAENLDGATRSKLTQGRYAALAAAKQKPSLAQVIASWTGARWWVAASGATAAAVIAAVLSFNSPRLDVDAHRSPSVFEDLELVASDDSLDLYRDMDFYAWLSVANSEDWAPSETQDDAV